MNPSPSFVDAPLEIRRGPMLHMAYCHCRTRPVRLGGERSLTAAELVQLNEDRYYRYYFDLPAGTTPTNTTLVNTNVRFCGSAALITFTRLIQNPTATVQFQETRVWERDGAWKMIHFHKS